MKGRKLGSIEVTQKEMEIIMKMTKQGSTRKEIADTVGRAKDTVWRYQKKLNLM